MKVVHSILIRVETRIKGKVKDNMCPSDYLIGSTLEIVNQKLLLSVSMWTTIYYITKSNP